MKDNLLVNKRELWIDVFRGIGILTVVLGHTSFPFNKFIYGFHMPLFFFLAGFLWKPRKRIVMVSFIKYIKPYFILCGINLLFEIGKLMLTHRTIPILTYIVGIFYSRGTTEFMPNCSPLWFLTALFIALVLYDMVQKISAHKIRFLLIAVFGIISAVLSYLKIFKLPWNIDTALMGLVFIAIGHFISEYRIMEQVNTRPQCTQMIEMILLVCIGMAAIYYNPVEAVSFDGNRYGNVPLMFIGAVSICFVLFYICYQIKWKGFIANVLSYFGRHTIFIMGFDYLSGSVANRLLGKIGIANWLSVFVLKVALLFWGSLIWTTIVSK